MTYETQSAASVEAFRNIIEPILLPAIGGGQFLHLEAIDEPIAKNLDQLAGLDVLWVQGGAVYGIAVRIQPDQGWRTFTMRTGKPSGLNTEYAKRQHARRHGALAPRWTVHAYVSNGTLVAAAIATTDAILDAIEKNEYREKVNRQDGTRFVAVPWADLPADQIAILPQGGLP